MSGGSYDYLFAKVQEAADRLEGSENALRRAFAKHLADIADALHAIEWVDSGDYSPGRDEELMRKCLAPGAKIVAATEQAERAYAVLGKLLGKP